MPRIDLELGSGFTARFYQWAPDRELNPQYEGIPDAPHAGIILTCRHGTEGAVMFAGRVPGEQHAWTVESEDPLTLSPSILRTECGCHGFIRQGRWVDA